MNYRTVLDWWALPKPSPSRYIIVYTGVWHTVLNYSILAEPCILLCIRLWHTVLNYSILAEPCIILCSRLFCAIQYWIIVFWLSPAYSFTVVCLLMENTSLLARAAFYCGERIMTACIHELDQQVVVRRAGLHLTRDLARRCPNLHLLDL